jgi:hypothetical protein
MNRMEKNEQNFKTPFCPFHSIPLILSKKPILIILRNPVILFKTNQPLKLPMDYAD